MHEIRLDSVDSTQSYAKKHCAQFRAHEITCIVAEEQTAGRGRFQRTWQSPKGGNIYATFYFRLPIDSLHIVSLAQVMAYSFASLLIREGFHPQIKWPNDIQLNGKKVSGILCETAVQAKEVEVFLGIGINVNRESVEGIDQPATSLFIETGRKWDKEALLKKLQKQFQQDLETFKRSGFTPFHSAFENLLAYKGQTIHCYDGKKTWIGICHSLTMDGQLNLYLPDKTIHTLSSGDIQN